MHSTSALVNPPKEDKKAYRVAQCSLKTYDGSYDPNGVRGMDLSDQEDLYHN